MSMEFRVSVRALVELTYFQPDITPGGDAAALLAGMRAHIRRQEALPPEAVTEKPISATVEADGDRVTIYGRMDAFTDGEVPYIDELKLCGAEPPPAPYPEHRAQAVLYAAMLCWQEDRPGARICVSYVSEDGVPRARYEESLTAEQARSEALAMLSAYLVVARREASHQQARDASLEALPFPFAQYRPGQREMAVQVYTAIGKRKRLFASLPTGTGKSAAVLYPALKALARGKTSKLLYLTARTTARQSPLNALERMRAQGMRARVSVLTAKEKLCPEAARCSPESCPRAKGHFIRQRDAIEEITSMDELWTDEVIRRVADHHHICPFEFALALTVLADVVLMDYNYVFDPQAQVRRLVSRRSQCTLLVDEAHHLLERSREMFSGEASTGELTRHRTAAGKACGRSHPYYKALSALLRELQALDLPEAIGPEPDEPPPARENRAQEDSAPLLPDSMPPPTEATAPSLPDSMPPPTAAAPSLRAVASLPTVAAVPPRTAAPLREGRLRELPPSLCSALEALRNEAGAVLGHPCGDAAFQREVGEWFRRCFSLLYAWDRLGDEYAVLLSCRGRSRTLTLYCLLPGKELRLATRRMRGVVCFSATLTPLDAMRDLLGGEADDACFALPSPFPPENLRVARMRVDTRYRSRDATAGAVAQAISRSVSERPGKYIAYFPSYAYLSLVLAPLSDLPAPPLLVQESDMSDDARERFLAGFTSEEGPVLGLCVLGGLFSEGVDLPGDQLIGAFIVGVGLPTPSLRLNTLRGFYQQRFGDGFAYACIYPGMQKVLQAAGRVIRSETDRGLVLLIDTRYDDWAYQRLLPPEWLARDDDLPTALSYLKELES